jgi:hypothetical protein
MEGYPQSLGLKRDLAIVPPAAAAAASILLDDEDRSTLTCVEFTIMVVPPMAWPSVKVTLGIPGRVCTAPETVFDIPF